MFIISATKCDVEISLRKVEKSDGEKLASRIEAAAFYECSSKENLNVESIFEAAIKINVECKDQSWLSLLSCNLLTKPVTSCIKNNLAKK